MSASTPKSPVLFPAEKDNAPYRVQTSMLLDTGPSDGTDSTDSTGGASAPTDISHTFVADPADILPPTVLVLDGQVIYAENAPGVVLYESGLGLAGLTPATKRVELERLDYDGSTRVRKRGFYVLGHINKFLPSLFKPGPPEWFIYSLSSRTAPLGVFGWREGPTDAWEALPARIEKHEFHWADGAKDNVLFRARYKKGVCTWTDAEHKEVAKLYEASRLVVTEPLRRDLRDVLVALWCCYVWAQALNRHVPVPVPRGKNPVAHRGRIPGSPGHTSRAHRGATGRGTTQTTPPRRNSRTNNIEEGRCQVLADQDRDRQVDLTHAATLVQLNHHLRSARTPV
ncbi:hypothetical protein SPBR_05134 [Sporothrix brasiliensis 5110]|uniref:Uncharacterized protein n=1 Tax=Sporothrix brasiliensis 5110 TaxID=1398154 RepID=A0A0C2F9X7_9PEZI|nr:uncharacterized protein SPBR_05134 [Sporothrix brasiliensis 5110]KIH87908.1 hypothetical protein SPBR_05134 [Sporothrix brasiliensis 5110]